MCHFLLPTVIRSRGYLYIYVKLFLFRFIHRLAFRFACFPFIIRGFQLFNEISSFSLQRLNSCNEVNYSCSHICKNNEVNAYAENLECREYGHEYAERGSGQYTDNRKHVETPFLFFFASAFGNIPQSAIQPFRPRGQSGSVFPISSIRLLRIRQTIRSCMIVFEKYTAISQYSLFSMKQTARIEI